MSLLLAARARAVLASAAVARQRRTTLPAPPMAPPPPPTAARDQGRQRRSLAAHATGNQVQQMTVQELAELLSLGDEGCEDVQFVDVREPGEFQAAKLPRFKLFPLSDAANWAPKIETILDPARRVVVLCHHGVRSMNAATFLASEKGFANVYNVTGGIDAYSLGADPSVPRY
jgi:rhodanese-related sulfurtransferase